ncbi:MAG: hypothetical protein H7210_00625, partial [Pyrinomonadaceae bacterium]|nr:hypothetical protein [Phycisphaerales bacterium]
MKARARIRQVRAIGLSVAVVAACLSAPVRAQIATPGGTAASTQPGNPSMNGPATRSLDTEVFAGMTGRNVEGVRVVGNQATSASLILNAVRTREGEAFDPKTVEEDYQRVFNLRRFANVEAKVEPTASGGLIVVFIVTEQ